MSDYRGPTAGPGDEPPDVVPRTGPPTGPARAPAAAPGEASEAASENPESTTEASPEAVDLPTEEVIRATVLVQPAEPQPAVLDTPSEASQSAEDTASSEVQFTLLGADEIVRDQPAQAVEQVDDAAFDQQPSEISATPPVLVRDVLVIDPAAAGPHQMATPPLADVMASEGAPPEAEQPLAAEPSTQEIAAVPHESFPPPPVEHSAPAAEAETAAETAAEAPLPPPLQLPRAIPTPALGAPAFVRPLSAAQTAPPVDTAPAIAAAPAILAPLPPPSVATRRPRSVWPGRFRRAA